MDTQKILFSDKHYLCLDEYFTEQSVKQIFLVCGKFVDSIKIGEYFNHLEERLGIVVFKFEDFSPNPTYENIIKAIQLYREKKYGMIVALGGGSAIDVAKCIKLFTGMDNNKIFLQQKIDPIDVPFLAIPTTAGTGSESTRYAVIYYQGIKQSITDERCIPDAVLFDASLLNTLPLYQRKSTLMDAFCHTLESYWSMNSTEESKNYSQEALNLIMKYGEDYLKNQESGNYYMLKAANLAGRAISITQTTAGHALCYKLTSIYSISHGHAAAICVLEIWRYMWKNINGCIDIRGQEYLRNIFTEIATVMRCKEVDEAIDHFENTLKKWELDFKISKDKVPWNELIKSVNIDRLKNTPVYLDEKAIGQIYHNILQ